MYYLTLGLQKIVRVELSFKFKVVFFSLLRSLIIHLRQNFLQNFGKTKKRRHFLDGLQPLHSNGW